jgi:copper chaperone CopZ
MNKMTYKIQNLKCEGCLTHILKKVSEVPGISEPRLDIEKNEITFRYLSFNTPELVKKALKRLGFYE